MQTLVLLLSCVAAFAQLNPHLFPTERVNGRRGPFRPVDPRRQNERVAEPVDDIDLVVVGVVSGERNPEVPLRDDPSRGRWGEEGPGQLNKVGKRQALQLGRALRERYSDLVEDKYDPTNFVAESSTGDSEQMTSQVVNAGLFPPVGRAVFDPSIQWQPVPVTTVDNVLGIGRIRECPTVREVIRPIFTGQVPEVRDVLRREREVVEYVRKNTGVRGTIDELAQVAENLRQLRVRNLPFPEWVERPRIEGVEKEELYRRIQIFRNAVEVACSVYEPCRKVVSGVLLNRIVDVVRNVRPRTTVDQTNVNVNVNVNVPNDVVTPDERRVQSGMVVYTADVEVILSVIRVLGLDYYNVVPTEAVVLEIRTTPVPSVRVVICRPDEVNPEVRRFVVARPVTGRSRVYDCHEDFCPIEVIVQKVREVVSPEYRGPCSVEDCVNGNRPVVKVTEDYREVDIFANPKVAPKGVDCTTVRDKYPESACRELARNQMCVRNREIRNVFCIRTCLCTQYDVVDRNQPTTVIN